MPSAARISRIDATTESIRSRRHPFKPKQASRTPKRRPISGTTKPRLLLMSSEPAGEAENPATTVSEPSVSWRPRDADAVVVRGDPTVVATLADRDAEVAGWYVGALDTLDRRGNPDRFAQAGLSLREVMNAVGRLAHLPQPAEGKLGEQFAKMARTWNDARRRSRCHDGMAWSGEIDEHALVAFTIVEETIEWNAANHVSRRAAFIEVARTMDGSGRTLPESEESRLWRNWDETKSYFNACAHHGKQTNEAEFRRQLERLDRFILQLFRRDVHAEQKRILELIARAEHGS